jgi:hypothetical protein
MEMCFYFTLELLQEMLVIAVTIVIAVVVAASADDI